MEPTALPTPSPSDDLKRLTLKDFMGEDNFAMYQAHVTALEQKLTEKQQASHTHSHSSSNHNQSEKKKFRNRPLTDNKIVYQQNAWDDVEWDEDQKEEAIKKVQNNSLTLVDENQRKSLEDNAADNWSKFYNIHQNKFFKDRTWLSSEFPEFSGPFKSSVVDPEFAALESKKKRLDESFPGEKSSFRILEVGCGNGSTVIPLLLNNNHPETYVYCCDFSEEAVRIVAENPKLDVDRCTPFQWDITQQNCHLPFPQESLDIVSMIFVLSAISPEKFDQVLQNLYKTLKPGGMILFRDYGLHDLVQLRIKPGRCISDNFYFRGDGTRVYFFTEEEIKELFHRNQLVKRDLFTDKRLQVNRIKQIKMYRVWVQGRFVKDASPSS